MSLKDDMNIMAGGPTMRFAALGTAFPTLTDNPITWTSWTEVPKAIEDVEIVFLEETEDYRPVDRKFRLADLVNTKGVDAIRVTWNERDLDALNHIVNTSVLSAVGSGGGEAGYDKLLDGGYPALTYVQLALELRAPTDPDEWYLMWFKKVRAKGDLTIAFGNETTKPAFEYKAFGLETAADDEEVWAMYEWTAAQS